MPEQRDEWTLDIAHVIGRVRRRWRVVVATALIATVAAGAAGVLAPRYYDGTASVAVTPIRIPGSTSVQQINIDTERAVMGSREVAVAAAGRLTGTDVDVLVRSTSVAAPEGSEVLIVTTSAKTPAQAADRANALAAAYLAFRAQSALQVAQPSIDALDARIRATATSDTGLLSDLRSQRVALQHVGDAVGRIIGRAERPDSPSSFGLPVYLVAGLATGLLAGLVLALLRDRTDARFRFAARFWEMLGRRGISMRRKGDLESIRWILRALRIAPGRRANGAIVAAVVGDEPALVTGLIDELQQGASVVQRKVRVVRSADLPVGTFDRDWSPVLERHDEIVLIDGSAASSSPERAALLEGVDAALVVAGWRTRTAAMQELLGLLGGADPEDVVPVFVERRWSAAVRRGAASPRALRDVRVV